MEYFTYSMLDTVLRISHTIFINPITFKNMQYFMQINWPHGQRGNEKQTPQGQVLLWIFAFTLSDLRSHLKVVYMSGMYLACAVHAVFCDKTHKNGKGKTRVPVRNLLQYHRREIMVARDKFVAFGVMKKCWVLDIFLKIIPIEFPDRT